MAKKRETYDIADRVRGAAGLYATSGGEGTKYKWQKTTRFPVLYYIGYLYRAFIVECGD